MKPEKNQGRGRGRGRGRGGTGSDSLRGRSGRGGRQGRGKATTEKAAGKAKAKAKAKASSSKVTPDQWEWDQWWDSTWTDEYGHEYSDGWWAADAGSQWDNHAWWDGKSSLQQLTANKRKVKDETKGQEKPDKKAKTEETTPSPPEKPKKKRDNEKKEDDEEPVAAPKRRCRSKTDETKEIPEAAKKQYLGTPQKDKNAIRKYVAYFTQTDASKEATEVSDTEKHAMRSKLYIHHLEESRLNIYWKKPGCGVTSHYQQKDVASFTFAGVDTVCYMVRLATALKCAEMFVTWVHEGLFMIKITDAQIFREYARTSNVCLSSMS